MSNEDCGDRRLSRRLLFVHGLAGASGTALAVGRAGPAAAQRSGITDTDPGDPEGNGRGGPPRGVTDTDPGDPPGRGRGGPQQGVTDQDPTDPPGRGRGNRRRAIDADPTD
jgi:hypothetical protein